VGGSSYVDRALLRDGTVDRMAVGRLLLGTSCRALILNESHPNSRIMLPVAERAKSASAFAEIPAVASRWTGTWRLPRGLGGGGTIAYGRFSAFALALCGLPGRHCVGS
jgi:hypothetical protein